MSIKRWFSRAAVFAALAASLPAQGVTLTGFVDSDFAGKYTIADPGGIDVAMPPVFGSQVSGWDLQGVALHYDLTTDTLFVGLDTYTIAGDADGNGNAGNTSSALADIGGIDRNNLSGGESFCVLFDLDGDGAADIMIGVPEGTNIGGFKGSFVPSGATPSNAYQNFGDPIPGFQGALLGSPFSGCPDLEFSFPGFCEVLNTFAGPGTESIGIHVYMGSSDDGDIGGDYIAGATDDDLVTIPLSAFDATNDNLPVLNNYRIKDVSLTENENAYVLKTEYGVQGGYGCCLLYSLADNPAGWSLPAPFNFTILVGVVGVETFVTDLGVPPGVTEGCAPKEGVHILPLEIDTLTIYAQIVAYKLEFNPGAPDQFFASNRIILSPDIYPAP